MGAVAWPTVLLGLTVAAGYVSTFALALTGQLSLWMAGPLVVVFTYLAYTVLHDAAHGSISGSHTSLRWMNEALGYIAAWILMLPLTAHRHEHLAHHRHTNDGADDPDFHVGDMTKSPYAWVMAAVNIFSGQFSYYMEHRWSKATGKQNLYLCLEIAAMLLPRLGLLLAGYWTEVLVLTVAGWLGGTTLLLYLFAYIVHRPHTEVGRYVDTSTILAPGPFQSVVTWLWMFQNYHAIHHLFPRVPFYQYAKLFAEIEPIMLAKGAPIYRLTMRGLAEHRPDVAALV
ncbi:fatty acid desaturase [Halioglobus maricola]|uniref:Fatty acid desaturase n=2 Tax=Halioglobus maricola TaxID=2601894 RepID=A0A5P9NQ35_9GAMM|nr:fatty acid desaturase [Halioglobus maricola]